MIGAADAHIVLGFRKPRRILFQTSAAERTQPLCSLADLCLSIPDSDNRRHKNMCVAPLCRDLVDIDTADGRRGFTTSERDLRHGRVRGAEINPPRRATEYSGAKACCQAKGTFQSLCAALYPGSLWAACSQWPAISLFYPGRPLGMSILRSCLFRLPALNTNPRIDLG